MTQAPLQVTSERTADAVVVRVTGEVDMNTAPLLEKALAAAVPTVTAPTVVVADLGGVTFLDSSGLSALINAHKLCEARPTELRIVATNPAVVRTFEIASLDGLLKVSGSLADATRPMAGPSSRS